MTHEIFISYSSRDKPVADGVCASLEAAGYRCWIAPRDIAAGEDWPTAITTAISTSRILVLIFSANSNASEDVSRELFLAADHRLVIIPFKIENVAPEPGKQYYLARTHWLDAMNPPTREQISTLIERVRALLPGQAVIKPVGGHSTAEGEHREPPVVRQRLHWVRWLWIPATLLVLALIAWGVLALIPQVSPFSPSTVAATATTYVHKTEPTATVPAAAMPATPDWDINVIDGFTTNISGWPSWSGTDDGCTVSSMDIQDNQLLWELDARDDYYCWYYQYPDLPAVTDFDLSVNISRSPGGGEASFGLAFRGDADNGYRFVISTTTNSYRVERYSYDDIHTVAVDYHTAILPEGSNRLEVSARGTAFYLYINDILVVNFEDEHFTSGQVGIVADLVSGAQVSLSFDNFILHGIEK